MFKLWLRGMQDGELVEGEVLSDQVAATFDCYGNSDNYNNCRMGWLFLTLESLWGSGGSGKR